MSAVSLQLLPDPPPQQSSEAPPVVPPVVPPLPVPVPELLAVLEHLQPPPALSPLIPDAAVLSLITPTGGANTCQALQLSRLGWGLRLPESRPGPTPGMMSNKDLRHLTPPLTPNTNKTKQKLSKTKVFMFLCISRQANAK